MSWKTAASKKGIIVALVGISSAIALGALVVSAMGLYDVGATSPHSSVVEKALRAGMERSVRSHAKGVKVPDGIDVRSAELAEGAIGHYSVACASCHAAPGQSRAPWMVLYPEPANLTHAAVVDAWSDEELYWIIKNGIKDTGMIALGPTHSEEDIWAVTAFVRQLPGLAPERYESRVARYLANEEPKKHEGHKAARAAHEVHEAHEAHEHVH